MGLVRSIRPMRTALFLLGIILPSIQNVPVKGQHVSHGHLSRMHGMASAIIEIIEQVHKARQVLVVLSTQRKRLFGPPAELA